MCTTSCAPCRVKKNGPPPTHPPPSRLSHVLETPVHLVPSARPLRSAMAKIFYTLTKCALDRLPPPPYNCTPHFGHKPLGNRVEYGYTRRRKTSPHSCFPDRGGGILKSGNMNVFFFQFLVRIPTRYARGILFSTPTRWRVRLRYYYFFPCALTSSLCQGLNPRKNTGYFNDKKTPRYSSQK